MQLLTIKNLSVSYFERQVLSNFNFVIEPGQIVAIIGPNGSGKSTLIKAIAGIVDYEGEIVFSKNISRKELQLGYVPQRIDLDFSLPISIQEFLKLSLQTCKHSNTEKNHFIKESLDKVGINNFEYRNINSLSGGELRRLLLARAIVHHPKLLLLDEVEAGLDETGELAFYKLVEQLSRLEKITSILVSHNKETISRFADRVISLN